MQVRYEQDYVHRSVYYLALLHSGQLNRGRKYGEINRTMSIHILGFDLLTDEPDFRNGYSLRNEVSGKILSDDILMIFVELPKYVRHLKAGRKPVNKLERWLGYLAGLEGAAMTSIASDEPMIEQALDMEKLFLMDYKQRLAYILDFRAMMDEYNHDENVKKEALAEGKAEVAMNMFEQGFDIEMVEKVTGLSRERVREIATLLCSSQ